jgi:hypothetical protein
VFKDSGPLVFFLHFIIMLLVASVMNAPESSETSGSTKQTAQHRDKLYVDSFHAGVRVPRQILGHFAFAVSRQSYPLSLFLFCKKELPYNCKFRYD